MLMDFNICKYAIYAFCGSISGSGKGRTKPCCAWCSEKKDLKYCLTVDHQKKDFCSEMCLHDYKTAFLKVFCSLCFEVLS